MLETRVVQLERSEPRAGASARSYVPYDHQPFPKQAEFEALDCREALYGGAAGSGKSDALLRLALQYVHVPGYAALLLRRTYPMLNQPGGLIPRSHDWLGGSDAAWNEEKKRWTFPSGATLSFGHMETERDKYNYQGGQYTYCVTEETRVRMGDGSLRAVGALCVGDTVMTLEGAKRVTRVRAPRWAACVQARLSDAAGRWVGTQIQTTNHRVLTPQGWLSYDDIVGASRPFWSSSPMARRPARRCVSLSCRRCRTAALSLDSQCADWKPSLVSSQGRVDHRRGSGSYAAVAQAARGSDSEACCNRRLDAWPRSLSSDHLVHPRPSLPSAELSAPLRALVCDGADVRRERGPLGYQGRCSTNYDRGGELLHSVVLPVLCCPQRSFDAAVRSPIDCISDVQGATRRCSHHTQRYAHPYTMDERQIDLPLEDGALVLTPCGHRRVVDITVADVSHYLTATGLVNQNCGFDELTQFTEDMYLYLFSRTRRLADSGVPIRVRAATNPGGQGHDWVKKRFDLEGQNAHRSHEHDGRYFVPATLDDNPALDRADYAESLWFLPTLERQQLLAGDWDATFGGNKFKAEWFRISDVVPPITQRLRYWDLAATEPTHGRDPDYTAGALVGRVGDAYYVLDIAYTQASPPGVEALVKQTAVLDGIGVPVMVEQEPGASGVANTYRYQTAVLAGFKASGDRATGSKELRANPLSALAGDGKVVLVEGEWNRLFLQQATAFPNGAHDDLVDCVAGAINQLALMPQSEYHGQPKGAKPRAMRFGRRL